MPWGQFISSSPRKFSLQFSSLSPFLQPGTYYILQTPSIQLSISILNILRNQKKLELTPFLLAALQAVDQATEESDEAICLLCAQLPLFSSSCSSHEVCERLAVVLLVVVKDKGRRSGTSEGSLCNQVSDVQGVAHSWDIVPQEH